VVAASQRRPQVGDELGVARLVDCKPAESQLEVAGKLDVPRVGIAVVVQKVLLLIPATQTRPAGAVERDTGLLSLTSCDLGLRCDLCMHDHTLNIDNN
jgi:hypothetical protein